MPVEMPASPITTSSGNAITMMNPMPATSPNIKAWRVCIRVQRDAAAGSRSSAANASGQIRYALDAL